MSLSWIGNGHLSILGRIDRTELFIDDLDDRGVTSLSSLTGRHLSDYIGPFRLSQKVHSARSRRRFQVVPDICT